MGYAGYAPGNQVAEALSALEQALRSIPEDRSSESLEVLDALLRNVVQSSGEEKFRRIRLANEKIAKAIGTVPGAVEALLAMGWVRQCQDEQEVLVLPLEVKLDFPNHINKVLEAKDYFQKLHARAVSNQKAAMRFAAAAESELDKAIPMQQHEAGSIVHALPSSSDKPDETQHRNIVESAPMSLRELRSEQNIGVPPRSSRGCSQPAPRTRSQSSSGSNVRTLGGAGASGPGRPASIVKDATTPASRPFGANVHTLDSAPTSSSGSSSARASSCGVAGSRLQQTTEAYRQQRGTTARTVGQVGRATMTPEKEAEVMRARTKVLGAERAAVGRPPSASRAGVAGARPPMPPSSRKTTGPGHHLGRA